MHVLLIHQAFVLPGEAGGTRHFELAQNLLKGDHRFSIVASNLNYRSGHLVTEREALITRQEVDGVTVLRTYTYPSLHRSFVWRVIAFLSFTLTSVVGALRVGSVDLVMGTSPQIFQALSAWFVSFLRRRPFLLEVRDLWPEFAIDIGVLKNPVLIRLSRWLESFLYHRADHIVVNSPAYEHYLIEKGVPEHKIDLIANGVDPDMFDPEATGKEIRERFHLQDKFVISYTGAFGLANDLPTIIHAAAHLRDEHDIHFMLIGGGKERDVLEALVDDLELTNVTITGPHPKDQMPAFLAASDACVATLKAIPMFRTTYPNKVFDYMAAGRPTILAIDGVIREVVEAANGGIFVPPGNSKKLAEAALSLRNNPVNAAAAGRAARAYVEANFDRRQQAREFAELIERVSASKR